MQDRVQRLEIATFGFNGDNGLVGTSKEQNKRLKDLEEYVSIIHTAFQTAKWVLATLVFAVGLTNVETVVRFLYSLGKLAQG